MEKNQLSTDDQCSPISHCEQWKARVFRNYFKRRTFISPLSIQQWIESFRHATLFQADVYRNILERFPHIFSFTKCCRFRIQKHLLCLNIYSFRLAHHSQSASSIYSVAQIKVSQRSNKALTNIQPTHSPFLRQMILRRRTNFSYQINSLEIRFETPITFNIHWNER